MERKVSIGLWLAGLAIFGVLIAVSIIFGGGSPYSIIDHQAAGSAAQVDVIQSAWRAAGERNLMIGSMIGDLIFIGVYSLGAWQAGQSMRDGPPSALSVIGGIVCVAAIVFCVSDYLETILQLVQMILGEGVDWMAGTAAIAQPIKIGSWVITFFGVIAGLIAARFT